MKVFATIVCFITAIAFCPVAMGQSDTDSGVSLKTDAAMSDATTLQFLSAQSNQPDVSATVASRNSVFIQQVGNYNEVVSNTRSAQSDINVFQFGRSNDVNLNIKALTIRENVVQHGANNTFLDLSARGGAFHNGQVIQRGTNQKLAWFGDNSISRNMRVTMQGRNQTVIVINRR